MLFFSFLTFLLTFNSYSQIEKNNLSLFVPKSPISAIRSFIGKRNITYFENSDGKLFMNQGLKNHILIDSSSKKSQFKTFLSNDQKYLLIEETLGANSNISFRKNNRIYWHDTTTQEATFLTSGKNPVFHEQGTLVTVVDIELKIIKIKSIKTRKSSTIQYLAAQNPYFIPSVQILKEKLFFTQINENGKEELVEIDLKTSKSKVILKAQTQTQHFSMCKNNRSIYINQASKKSKIFEIREKLKILASFDSEIYQIVCTSQALYLNKENVYISKTFPQTSETFKISYQKKTPIRISRLPGRSSIFKNADQVFLLNNSKYYKVLK